MLAATALAAAAVSCEKTDIGYEEQPKALDLSTKAVEYIREGNTFAFDYIDRINAVGADDYIVSPLSLQILLGMVLDGAGGETAGQIVDVLGYGAGEQAEVDRFCQSLLKQLPRLDRQVKLSMADALFADKDFPVLSSYKTQVSRFYQAEISNLDFSNQAGTLKTINDWCSKNTNGLIPKMLDAVSPDARLFLLNALYFKGQWKEPFNKDVTRDEPFTDEAGSQSQVKMMIQKNKFAYSENDIFQAVSIPYGSGSYSMTAFLPKAGHKVSEVVSDLKSTGWDTFRGGMQSCDVTLWRPKFETKFSVQLADILSAMGMPDAFDIVKADFSALSKRPLYLLFVKQDAIIKVDEEGTEAAAVSIAAYVEKAIKPEVPPVVFKADHPFLYLITESSTGAILFAGRYSGK